MFNLNKETIMKTVLIFIAYFAYTMVISSFCGLVGIVDSIQVSFIADLLFAFFIVYLYKDDIKKGYVSFIKNNSFGKRFLIVFSGVIALLSINIFGGVISDFLFSDIDSFDQNTTNIYELASMSAVYLIFKTLIFASVVENIIFRVCIRKLTKNNYVFIIASGLIYALVNVMYSNFSFIIFVDIIQYFLISVILSYIYVKNKDSIYPVILVLFSYNLIPLMILLFGIGA